MHFRCCSAPEPALRRLGGEDDQRWCSARRVTAPDCTRDVKRWKLGRLQRYYFYSAIVVVIV